MSGSVAVDAFRAEEWDREAAGTADDIGSVNQIVREDAGSARPATGAERLPPWPRRRLNEALAELGPARPGVPAPERPTVLWSRADQEGFGEPQPEPAAAPEPEPAADATPEPKTEPPARVDLPPPPRPFFQPANAPFEAAPIEQAMLAWSDASLSDVDPAGADIIRALAFADRPSADDAASRSRSLLAVDHDHHDDEQERPPMIIERALAEQGLGTITFAPEAQRINPLPPISIGFSLSLVAGAALYLAMMAG